MKMKRHPLALAMSVAALLTGCGGGGGGGGTPEAAQASTVLSGVAFKGPIKGGKVAAYPVDSAGSVGTTKIAETDTGQDGGYTLKLGSYEGVVHLEVTAVSGTTTADEATGTTVPLPADFKLSANTVINKPTAVDTKQSASVTVYTDLANTIAKDLGGIKADNISNANGVVYSMIGVDPVATTPVFTKDGSEEQKRYALLNAAVSQLAFAPPAGSDLEKCTDSAGSDVGKKVQCAGQQIATSVTVSSNEATVNKKMEGLSTALIAISSDEKRNPTGTLISTDDSAFKTLSGQEVAAVAGTAAPIKIDVTTEARSDVATAKRFFSGLRSNAAALKKGGPIETGIADTIKPFADSLRGDASLLTVNALQVLTLAADANRLWKDYQERGPLLQGNSSFSNGFSGGCTIYQGEFPSKIGDDVGKPYILSRIAATQPGNASWVGCSLNSGALPTDGTARSRQSIWINFSAPGYPTQTPYIAVTRQQYADVNNNNVSTYKNLTPTFTGFVQLSTSQTATLVGDLPPVTKTDGSLAATKYQIDLGVGISNVANNVRIDLTAGKLSLYPLNPSAAPLIINLSKDGESFAVMPPSALGTIEARADEAVTNYNNFEYISYEAYNLWSTYKNSPTSGAVGSGSCAIFKGDFPQSESKDVAKDAILFYSSLQLTDSPENARWVGCSTADISAQGGFQLFLYNFGAATDPAAQIIPVRTITRFNYLDSNAKLISKNLTPMLDAVIDSLSAFGSSGSGINRIKGALAPRASASGEATVDYYKIDTSFKTYCQNIYTCVYGGDSLGSIEIYQGGNATAGLTVNLLPGYETAITVADGTPEQLQIAAAKLNLALSISNAQGSLTGGLLLDNFSQGLNGFAPGHVKFTGDLAVTDNGVMKPLLIGSLEVSNGAVPKASFAGTLTLSGRPTTSLMLSITKDPATFGSLEGKYEQGGIIVNFTGKRNDAGVVSATFSDSMGVAVSVVSTEATSKVMVKGRETAAIDRSSNRITYADGTFESLQ